VTLTTIEALVILLGLALGWFGRAITIRLDAIGNMLFASFGEELCDCEECREERDEIVKKAKSIEETTNAKITNKQEPLWEDIVADKTEEE